MDKIEALTIEEAEAKGWDIETQEIVDPGGYVTESQLAEELNAYAKKNDLDSFITDSDLTDYAKGSDVEKTYAKKTDLNGFVTDSDLTEYAKESDVENTYAKKTDLNGFVTSEQLKAFLEAALANVLRFDASNNITLRDGSKILAQTQNGVDIEGNPIYVSRELIGLNRYVDGDGNTFYQSELGNKHVQTVINTTNRVNVDKENGSDILAYTSELGEGGGDSKNITSISRQLAVGDVVSLPVGDLALKFTASSATNLLFSMALSDSYPESFATVNYTQRVSGSSYIAPAANMYASLTPSSTVDVTTLTFSNVRFHEYWIKWDGKTYYLVFGSHSLNIYGFWAMLYKPANVTP